MPEIRCINGRCVHKKYWFPFAENSHRDPCFVWTCSRNGMSSLPQVGFGEESNIF